MSHKDANRVQVPRSLPEWIDGPAIKKRAERLGISYARAKYQMQPNRQQVPEKIDYNRGPSKWKHSRIVVSKPDGKHIIIKKTGKWVAPT